MTTAQEFGKSSIDPVCGMEVIKASTPKNQQFKYKDVTYYFCSVDCKSEFESAPEDYVGDEDDTPMTMAAAAAIPDLETGPIDLTQDDDEDEDEKDPDFQGEGGRSGGGGATGDFSDPVVLRDTTVETRDPEPEQQSDPEPEVVVETQDYSSSDSSSDN